MRKQFLAAVALLILLALLPVNAFAATGQTIDPSMGNSLYTSYYGLVYDAYDDADRAQVLRSDVPQGGAAVLLFVNLPRDNNSKNLVRSLTAADWTQSDKLNIVAFDALLSKKADVREALEHYDTNGVIDRMYYSPNSNAPLLWYAHLAEYGETMGNGGPSAHTSLAYAVVITEVGGTRYIRYHEVECSDAAGIAAALQELGIIEGSAGEGQTAAKDCTIRFNANGGSIDAQGAQYAYTDAYGRLAALPDAQREGFAFLGWYDAQSGGSLVTTDTVFTQDMVIYARWEQTGAGQTEAVANGKSGDLAARKLSEDEIIALLEDNPTKMPANIFDIVPSVSAPYAAGKVSDEVLQRATDRLNMMRRLAGLPEVTLDRSLCENAQYGAVLMAKLGYITHTPPQPSDMDKAFYRQGRSAAGSSNLGAGDTILEAIGGLMDDTGDREVGALGHRRWQLNPDMGKVGFGYAVSNNSFRTYNVEKVFDSSGPSFDYNFIGWPASGNFPNTLFAGDTAWSISLNPAKYRTPTPGSGVKVTLAGGGKTWTFADGVTNTSTGKSFEVSNAGYGISNCIIFRPDGIAKYEGAYTVTVSGVVDKSGRSADFSYTVNFFAPYSQSFDDVPEGAYYADAVAWAVRNKIASGVSDTQFDPNGQCTRGQVVSFLWRAAGRPEPTSSRNPFRDVPAGAYYYDAVLWAVENGITSGESDTVFNPGGICTRAQIISFLWRAAGRPAYTISVNPFADVAATAYYHDAVLWAVSNRLISFGMWFGPNDISPRAEVVTYLYRERA